MHDASSAISDVLVAPAAQEHESDAEADAQRNLATMLQLACTQVLYAWLGHSSCVPWSLCGPRTSASPKTVAKKLVPHRSQICHSLPHVVQVLAGAKVVSINGFVFDELPMEVVLQAAQHASEAGSAIFFDPGPRAWSMAPAKLHAMVRKAHVVLMTQVGADSPVYGNRAMCEQIMLGVSAECTAS